MGNRYMLEKYYDPLEGVKEVSPEWLEDPAFRSVAVQYEAARALLNQYIETRLDIEEEEVEYEGSSR